MKIRPECATCAYWQRDTFCTRISCGLKCWFDDNAPPDTPSDWPHRPAKASDTHVGGDYYKTVAIQPWDVVDTWPLEQRIGYYRGGALKYVMRMGAKGASAQEIAKGKHYLEKLLEVLK